jgi:eukaryotic-like serine/threonine-protein kinase
MTAEDYRRAGLLFDQLRELPEEQRTAALDAACAGNPELRAQVLRLLDADRDAAGGAFLERRAIDDAARLLAPGGPKLPAPGTVIGNYCLGARIGAGGMGVVYEGQDLRLHRRVAIKILLLPFGGEQADMVKRFQREARAASMLNHPNILSIFDADFDQGHYFIATEFVEGKTLGQIAAAGRVERKVLLDIAVQLCSALGAAHEAGIVHRDIKPDNVMVRPDGIVKVLDFGLAKLVESANRPDPDLRTRTGIVAGTPQYMSPEQVLGNPVGPPCDIFSAGVLIYQLATGRRPFDGPTEGAIFTAIVGQAAARPSELGASIDHDLEALIMRALEKDPELRFQTANDMRSSLRLLLRGSQDSLAIAAPQRAPIRTARGWQAAALGALGGMTLMGLLWWALGASPLPLPSRFERMTFGEGEAIYPNLSPDGKQLIYASSARGNWDIYLQRAGGSAAIDLTADSAADDTEPALSHDGSRIAFRSDRGEGGLFVMEATGENPRRIAARGHLPAWSPDGKSVVYCDDAFIMPNDRGAPGSHLHVLDLAANTERELQTEDAVQPNWSPHGQRIAYWGIHGAGNREIFTVAAGGGTPVQVTNDPAIDWNPVWAPSGRELYFISDRGGTMNLWCVRIDERTGKTSGRPEPVTTPAVYVRFLSWSADGTQFLYSQAQNRIRLFAIDFDKSRLETAGNPVPAGGDNNIGNFGLSPDESKIVHDTVGDIHEDLWIVNVDGSGRHKLTSDSFRNRLPRWSPQGDEILFISTRSGQYQEWLVHPDGSGLHQLTAAGSTANTGVWIDGGRRIVASLFGFGLALVDPNAASPITEPQMLPGLERLNGFSYAFVSPPENGLMLGHIAGNGENPLVLYSLAEEKLTRLGVRGTRPAWIPGTNNRYFVFLRDDACYLYDRELKREKRLFSTGHNEMYFLQISASGRRIYFTETIRNADLWMGEMGR